LGGRTARNAEPVDPAIMTTHMRQRILVSSASPPAIRTSNARLNALAAPAPSITIKSLSCRLRPDAENFAAPVRSNRQSAATPI